MSLLLCENLNVGYNGKTVAAGINFSVEEGDYFCIFGENGSGKSTLMKTILGLIPPVSGKIEFSKELKGNQIGYLPQLKDFQKNFPASVQEVVLSGRLGSLGIFPFYRKSDYLLMMENLYKLGIADLRKKSYQKLSGGQQQRVLLARALCAAKKMIVLDEPVTGLDPDSQAEMYATIEKLNKNDKMTVIMISHDVGAASKYANKFLTVGEKK
ncbi:MAG: ABC transporter ATP-binding protein [Treponema sp.]|jgi:zinc transport system ATP-binding protein|nr:ABC transporter ATP-binding protein [Treponema sp.]